MKNKHITIWGTSFKKTADEAQLLAHYQIIKSFSPESSVTFITRPRPEIEKLYPEIRIVPFIRPISAMSALFKSDLLVIGGGPFYDEMGQLIKCALLILTAKLRGIPILVYGVTVFPVKSWWGKKGFAWLLNQTNAILARDRMSLTSLAQMGVKPEKVHEGIDLRLLLDSPKPEHIQEILVREGIDAQRPVIAITTRHFDTKMPAWVKKAHEFDDTLAVKANEAMGRVVDHLGKFGQLVLIPMHPDMEEDLATAEAIRAHMVRPEDLTVLSRRYLSAEMIGILEASSLVFAGRVGSVLFAATVETPILAIAYEERTTELMHDLDLKDYVFDWKKLNAEEMFRSADRLWSEREQISGMLGERTRAMRRTAESDARLYAKFLTGTIPS